ncbi:STAS domain-containing protein [Kitasatospora sp. NPDC051853]|uniref:STAS domain-containing protein n=1 Tax=Kitasatospora sp. NPDC051853 TaxID=3364058 RepID=UPI0037B901C0
MSFDVSVDFRGTTAVVTIGGDLDAASAPAFQKAAESVIEGRPKELVLEMSKVDYISSAGLRQIVYTRQKMDDDVRVVLVGVNSAVEQTIRLVGFDQSVTFADSIPA